MSDWVSPFDRWVLSATDRQGKPIYGAARLMLVALHSRADAPSKREGPGPLFVFGEPVQLESLAKELLISLRTAEFQFGSLRDAGLVSRGYHWVFDRRESGIWLADVPNTGRFGDEGAPIEIAGLTRNGLRVDDRAPAMDCGSHPQPVAGLTRNMDRVSPAMDCGSLNKEDPINSRSVPDHSPANEAGPARPAQSSLFDGEHAADPAEALWALHERLSIEAYAKHGRTKAKGGALGQLPKRSSTSGRSLLKRIRAAVREHGFDRCEEALRWRAAEWAVNIEQLSRPPDQAWHPKALAFVFGKLDAGLNPRGNGNMSHASGLAMSSGEAPPPDVYEDVFMTSDGEFDYDAARSFYDDEYRKQNGGRR